MPAVLEKDASRQPGWEQRLLRNTGRPRGAVRPEYQELKFTLHRKLLDKIDLEALANIENDRVRGEVRQALFTLMEGEPTLLSSAEKTLHREINPVYSRRVSTES